MDDYEQENQLRSASEIDRDVSSLLRMLAWAREEMIVLGASKSAQMMTKTIDQLSEET